MIHSEYMYYIIVSLINYNMSINISNIFLIYQESIYENTHIYSFLQRFSLISIFKVYVFYSLIFLHVCNLQIQKDFSLHVFFTSGMVLRSRKNWGSRQSCTAFCEPTCKGTVRRSRRTQTRKLRNFVNNQMVV